MSNMRIHPIVSISLLACAILLSFTFGFAEDSGRLAPETFPGHSSWITSIAVSGNGEVIAAGGGETLTIKPGQASFFDTGSGTKLSGFEPHKSTVWSVSISPDGETLATAGTDKLIKLWRTQLGGKMKLTRTMEGHKNWVTAISFSPD